MAKSFLRIDLSENGQFFHPVALEPGCPLIDPTNANDRILFRWFRGMTPEPEWTDENCTIIQYYLRNDQGARLEDIEDVAPVTNDDLKELLAGEIERLQLRFDAIRPISTTEKILYQRLSEEFRDLIENTKRPDRTYYFFKYQDVTGAWRLIWIPGYTPKSQEGGTPMICDDDECKQLYLRLPKTKAVCPICAHVPTAKRKAVEAARRKRNFYCSLAFLLFLVAWVVWNQFTLRVTPGVCETAAGTSVNFKVITPGLDGFGLLLSRDVTQSVLRASENPNVVCFLENGASNALAVTPGETKIKFQTGLRRKSVKFTVTPPVAPESVWIESSRENLAVGTTAQVRLLGNFGKKGKVIDLTHAAKWVIPATSPIYFNDGFIEAKKAGKAELKAVYTAPGDTKAKEAVLALTVTKAPVFTEIAIELPNEGKLAPASRVNYRVVGKTAEKATFDLTGSSKLTWAVTPSNALEYHGSYLKTGAEASGNLAISYADGGKKLDTSVAFTVGTSEKIVKFQVFPPTAEMAVDQKLPMSVLCADLSTVKAVSSNPEIVEVDQNFALIARDAGEAQVTFSCGSAEIVVPVKTSATKTDAVYVLPPRVNVPQDHNSEVLFLAQSGDGFHLLANDAVDVAASPDEAFAIVNPIQKSIFGRSGTTTPETVVYAHQSKKVTAEVAVNVPPLKFEIRPEKELKLPLGLCRTFTGIATYGDGVTAFVDNTRIAWAISPEPTEEVGFRFENGRAMAYKQNAGPFQIKGTYCARESAPVTVSTVEATDVELALCLDRALRIEGEPGKAILTGRTADGDVELVPGLAKFSSTDAEKVAILDEASGLYRAIAQGKATLKATHPASVNEASADLQVVHPRHLEMYWAPDELNLAVGEKAPFQLRLKVRDPKLVTGEATEAETTPAPEVKPTEGENVAEADAENNAEGTEVAENGEKAENAEDAEKDKAVKATEIVVVEDTIWDVPMNSPGVYYSIEQPDAVKWQTVSLTGLRPAEPFRVTASYLPYLKNPAVAVVSVAQKETEELRVIPAEVTLAPGQTISLKVEEKTVGADGFTEAAPEMVRWDYPRNVFWTDAENGIRPMVTAPADGTKAFTLTARFGKKVAACQVTVAEPKLNPADPAVELVLERQPGGAFLPVGQSQSYEIWMQKGNVREPAPDVFWTPNFVNTQVQWKAPVLTAEAAGNPVFLQAQVGERLVNFWTQPIDTSVQGEIPPLREGQPSSLRIVSYDDGDEVTVPVGAVYTNYAVEAEYPDGFVRIVTKDATLHAISGDPKAVTPSNGDLVAVKKGTVTYVAEYAGAETDTTKLTLNVTEDVDIDALKLEPEKSIRMLEGETVTFKLHGFKEGKSVGVLTGMGNITWNTSDPAIATPQGPVTTAKALGKADITATLNGITSAPAGVEVVATIDEKLGPTDNVIKMMVGESRLVGKDFALIRGNVDFSMQCHVTPLVPEICEYDASRHALVGKTPGATDVIFTMGDKKAVMRAVVGGVDAETVQKLRTSGKVIMEPAVITLSAGQMINPSVYAVTDDGVRLERTNSAVFKSSNSDVIEVRGLWLCAKKSGTAVITAQIPDVPSANKDAAEVTVDANPITELVVEPGLVKMSVGDKSNLFIQGRSASGLRRLFDQPTLKVATDGPAAAMNGINLVEARSAGQANINIDWNGQLKKQVPVQVDDNPYADLTIDPATATVAVGEGRAYQVTATRGGRLYVIQPATGLELVTKDPNIAVVQNGLVFGRSVGRTTVIARFAGLVSEGVLDVVEPGAVPVSVEGTYIDPNEAVIYRPADTVLDGGVVGVTSTEIFGDDYVAPYVVQDGVVNGTPVGLRFMDSTLRLSKTGSAVAVEVYEELADGRLGRNVSADPNLKLNFSRSTATAELTRGADGIYQVKPLGEKRGTVTVNATLGDLSSAIPLVINVGDVAVDGATLNVFPGLLYLVAGGSGTVDSVQVNPGNGMMPMDVAYQILPPADASVVSVDGSNQIRANAPGNVTLVVKSVDPNGAFDGLTATLPVTVSPRLNLTITPKTLTIRDGETTPAFVVNSLENGVERPVPADIVTTDETVLSAVGNGRFQAVGPGKTQVWGSYMGNELYADVTVIGERYQNVESELASDNSVTGEFSIRFNVLASNQEGALEYRVYQEGQAPTDVWQPATASADGQLITIESPKIDGRFDNDHVYRLIIESRTQGQQNIQQYPCSFRLFHQGRMLQ
ncbi:MAG: Ig-like domain-containing protein, partial [Planctomycetia bacterium]|nr:Ig-like domain-containing protein [Planctomycetia bacterium]